MTDRGSVIIVGAGPAGLMLGIELGRRGVDTVIISDATETSSLPKATVTQARTMEHFRRLGFAERIRNTGVPGDHPTDIVYCSRISWHEIARHRLPSPNEARRIVKEEPSRWHTPELTHRSCQMWVEPILLDECRRFESVDLQLGWRLERFCDDGESVTVEAERVSDGQKRTWSGAYLAGCDGALSTVREQLGIGLGESSGITEFKGRRMFSIHARAPRYFERLPHKPGWLYAAVNCTQRGSNICLNGTEFKFSFWRPPEWTSDQVSRAQMDEIFVRMFGRECEFDVINCMSWKGGAALVADSFRRGRVLLVGDAAHLSTPSAGLGYCTGIDDAADLGWKLAATVKGWGGPALLDSYEVERRPEAQRRTAFAAECAERLAVFKPSPALEENTVEGEQARARAARHFAKHLPFQYDIPGINFGARVDGSAIVVEDRADLPRQGANLYVPTAKPGGRAPHAWLPDGRSLFDTFGDGFTLLKLGTRDADVEPFRRAAATLNIPLTVVVLPDSSLRDLYEADLALIRPDQIVAWRGSGQPARPEWVLRRISGW